MQGPRVIAVGGGKGGTGKSLLAANIGIYLTTLGNRVVVVDAAFGGANLHVLVGGVRPHRTLAEVLAEDGVHLREITEDTPVPGLQLISGRRDPAWAATPDPEQVARLAGEVRQLEADWVIIDLGPGTRDDQLDLFLAADAGLLVVVPEPTSVELVWRFIRAAFLRRLHRVGLAEAGRFPAHELRGDSGIPAPLDLYERALGRTGDGDAAEALRVQIARFAPQLVINFARSKAEMDLGHAMASAGRRRLGPPIGYLGHVEYDEAVWVALRRSRPLLIDHPETRVAKCIEKVTRRLMGWIPEPLPEEVGRDDNYYELLEVAPTSSFEDIRRANRRVREIYAPDSVVVGGLYSRERLEALHRRFDEAYGVLMDAARRKEYDQRLFPEGMPSSMILGESAPRVIDGPPRALPPMPMVTSDTEFTGALLRQIREAKGIELREIAERSKVGMGYLQAIEDENWSKLPAIVYTRGFLVEYAKAAGLDPHRVADSFLDRFRRHRKPTNA